jgi:hypothetical protein
MNHIKGEDPDSSPWELVFIALIVIGINCLFIYALLITNNLI